MKYAAKVLDTIENAPGTWNSLNVGVFELFDDAREEQIGQYVRNYGRLYDTFFPFEQNGKYFALYSPDYTATRIMELPSCRDIGGEEPHSWGFCPVDFFVPTFIEQEQSNNDQALFGETKFVRVNNPEQKDL